MLSITGNIVPCLPAVGFTTETLPVKQGFYLFIPGVSMISQFLWPAHFSLVIKKVIQCCFQIKSIFCPPRGSHQGDPLWCVFEILELSQVGADQVSSWSFKSFSHRGSWRKHHVQGMTLEGLRWSRVPRVSREGISHARDHHYLFSVSSSLPCSGECISVSSNLPSSWCAVELLQNPRATVKVTQL